MATQFTLDMESFAAAETKSLLQGDLFSENAARKFPQPQYLGAKYLLCDWISDFIPAGAQRVLDAFGGSQSVAYRMKSMGKEVVTNDFLAFCDMTGKALVENSGDTLSSEDLTILFSPNRDASFYNLMQTIFSGIFFSREEAESLDSFRSNVPLLHGEYKKALALSVMCRALTRKVTMGHFAHTRALEYAASPERIKRNRSLIRPISEIFLDLLPQYNSAVFDNARSCISHRGDILELLPTLRGIDFVYFDPPYCGSHADYQSFYHLLETFVMYWKEKAFVNGTRRYEPKRHSGFDKICESVASLKALFALADDMGIPEWLVSYNNRSFPSIEEMRSLLARHRKVLVFQRQYASGRGGKGSVAGSSEILFACKKIE